MSSSEHCREVCLGLGVHLTVIGDINCHLPKTIFVDYIRFIINNLLFHQTSVESSKMAHLNLISSSPNRVRLTKVKQIHIYIIYGKICDEYANHLFSQYYSCVNNLYIYNCCTHEMSCSLLFLFCVRRQSAYNFSCCKFFYLH